MKHADKLHLEKPSTVLFCTLNRETHLEQFQLAETSSENSQNILILATQDSLLGGLN
jgi:hypothetical protein